MVDRQHRPGAHTGSGGVASYDDANIERRERQKKLALEQIDITKDPYFMRNHLGTYECRLCLTLHTNEGSYLAHTQGKKHQNNLARRSAKDFKETPLPEPKLKQPKKKSVKIGRPGYRVVKQKDPVTAQKSLLFEIQYPDIQENFTPRYRIMSPYEQKIEMIEKQYQYLLFAAEPYETIAFKIPNIEIDHTEGKFYFNWDKDDKVYTLQLYFKKVEKKTKH
eukprot:TRINITY_DN696_c0_g1_i3.p1 TRINITY_DN696_c0_g1~~TRINITY_DN696_c0_g1_i3.p1  ORF type:complete len:221 (-),score=43.36 TRINITY_DN696_c0_g1_i3:29-691(-)